MLEKFPEQIQPEKERGVEIELPEDVENAIMYKGEYEYSVEDNAERRQSTIKKWLSTANTREEPEKMFQLIGYRCYRLIGDDGAMGEEADIYKGVLMDLLLKKREEAKR